MGEGSEPGQEAGDLLASRLAEVVDAGLRLGASMARTLASASGSTDVGPTGRPPLDDIVTYTAATAGNLVGMMASGGRRAARVAGRGRQGPAVTPDDMGPSQARPIVRAGAALRVPLIVQNPGASPTRRLEFTTASLRRLDCPDDDGCGCLPANAVAFSPPSLTVAARDFEKLTVRVEVPADTAPGTYTADITAGDGWFHTALSFDVAPT